MMDDNVIVEIKDKENNVLYTWSVDALISQAALNAKLYEAFAKEGFDQYRYFGNLRSLITWAPTAAILLLAYRLSENDNMLGYFTITQWAVGAVFLIVFVAQYSLQKRQRQALNTAAAAQRELTSQKKVERIPEPDASCFGAFTKSFKNKWYHLIMPDFASLALLVFYAIIVAAVYATNPFGSLEQC